MKQTAVDWLADNLHYLHSTKWDDILEQAKEMEKEQMIDFAFKYGDLTTREIADSFDKEYKTK
jgi:hypothetical protein